MEKGWLTKKQERSLAEMADNGLKLKSVWELADGFVLKTLITITDDNLLEKIKVSAAFKTSFSGLADACIAKDIGAIQEHSAKILNILIDIPGLEEVDEGLLFEGAVKFIIGAIQSSL